MNEPRLNPILLAGMGMTVLAAMVGGSWDATMALGIAAGGLWNIANLWCLTHALRAWLGAASTKRRTVMWVLLKFPLLYAAVVMVLMQPAVSPVGFAIGFSLVLGLMLLVSLRHVAFVSAHGR